MQENRKSAISVGPWGALGGHHFDDGVYSNIKQLEITHGTGIDSLKILYDKNGTSAWSEKHGGNGGDEVDKVKLDYPDEYLASIQGYYGSLFERGPIIVRSLTFHSNRRAYGPYGTEQGTFFSSTTTQGKIVGFHGKCGWYLDAIGVHLEPPTKMSLPNSIVQMHSSLVHGPEKHEYSMLQGSLGKNYDLILAVRHKDRDATYMPDDIYKKYSSSSPYNLSRQTSSSRELSHTEFKNKVEDVLPMKVERLPSKVANGIMTYGVWGGHGGSVFDDGIYDGIRAINVSRNVAVVSIQVCYDLNGKAEWGPKNGGTGGFKTDKVVLCYPSEVLTHITGYYGHAMGMGPFVVKSLTFHTTKGIYGPYGEEHGQPFSTKLREGVVVGFHGRKGMFIDAIGVHVLEGKIMPPPSSPSHISNHQNKLPASENGESHWSFKLGKRGLVEEAVQRIVKNPAPFGPGPWGGEGGKPWDDGVYTGIRQIILTKSEAICSMEVEYDRNGQSVWSVKHGGNHANPTPHRIKLEYPNEVITCVSGYYGPLQKDHLGTKVMKSLTFHTTRRKIGPFGEEVGNFFTSATTEGKVVGFHGRSSMYLDAIGVHMQHWLGNHGTSKPSSIMKIFS